MTFDFNQAPKDEVPKKDYASIEQAEQKFIDQARSFGLEISVVQITDDVVRCKSRDDKGQKKSGWYVIHEEDNMLFGAMGDWKTGLQRSFCSRDEWKIDYTTQSRINEKIAEAKKQAEIERKRAAESAEKIISNAPSADPKHPYLQAKKVLPYGIGQIGEDLFIPIMDLDGNVMSSQKIDAEGTKKFAKGGNPVGIFEIGAPTQRVVICEGFATGASIHEATGLQVVVTFSAQALVKLSPEVNARTVQRGAVLLIGADNDEAGLKAAQRASEASGGLLTVAPSVAGQDWNDVAQSNPSDVRKAFLETEQPAAPFLEYKPIDFSQLTYPEMIYGDFYAKGYTSVTLAPPKVGKSMLALAQAVDMATGKGFLTGIEKAPLKVVYFNAEDDQMVLNARIAALCTLYDIDQHDLQGQLFPTSGVEWNRFFFAEGEDGLLREDVFAGIEQHALKNKIDCIIFDPLQDMHDAEETNSVFRRIGRRLRKLATEADVAISLIHHTRKLTAGISATIDDGRGGSALRGTARFNALLVPMSEQEATNAGVDDHRHYFRIGDTESNLMPPSSEKNQWFEKVSVRIDAGFSVGAIRKWKYPDAFDGIKLSDAKDVRKTFLALRDDPPKFDSRASNWAGEVIAEVLGLDVAKKADKARVKSLLSGWISTDVLKVENWKDKRRGGEAKVVVAGENDLREEK